MAIERVVIVYNDHYTTYDMEPGTTKVAPQDELRLVYAGTMQPRLYQKTTDGNLCAVACRTTQHPLPPPGVVPVPPPQATPEPVVVVEEAAPTCVHIIPMRSGNCTKCGATRIVVIAEREKAT